MSWLVSLPLYSLPAATEKFEIMRDLWSRFSCVAQSKYKTQETKQ